MHRSGGGSALISRGIGRAAGALLFIFLIAAASARAEPSSGTVIVRYAVTSRWETGFSGELVVTNQAGWEIPDWRISFHFAPEITSLWNGAIRSRAEGHYLIGPRDNASLAPGESLMIGFVARGRADDLPQEVTLNASPIVLNGASSVPKPPMPTLAGPWPVPVFAPYIDATAWPPLDFMEVARKLGVRHFHLGFVVAVSPKSAEPSWGGYQDATTPHRPAEVEDLRKLGGDIAIVFGGAVGTELAVAAHSVDELMAAYRSVIDANGARVIDFDIEGAWLAHRESVERRSQALSALQRSFHAEGRPLSIWLTLPLTPNGLTADGVNVIRSALAHGVVLDGVNGMAMNYGTHPALRPEVHMGAYAVDAAYLLHRQLHALLNQHRGVMTPNEVWRMVGITPMIGANDVALEVFRQSDAKQLTKFAREAHPGLLSFWSLNRDRPCERLPTAANPGCSSITQQPYEFTRIFRTVMFSSASD